MKKVILLSLFVSFFLVSCQDSNYNPVSSQINQPALQKNSLIGGNGIINVVKNVTSSLLSITKLINGRTGGSLQIVKTILVNNQLVKVNANIKFSRGAFDGNKNITMIVDPNDASITFLPHIPSFNNKVKLDATIEGLDLQKLNFTDINSIYFAYYNDAGIPVEEIACTYVGANVNSGSLIVKGAELRHFTRYSWANRN